METRYLDDIHLKENLLIDKYCMVVISKYFQTPQDYLNIICVNSKYKGVLEQFRFNPISVKTLKLFPNIRYQYLYNLNDNLIANMDTYVAWYKVSFEEYKSNSNTKMIFKHVVFTKDSTLEDNEFPVDCDIIGSHCFERSDIQYIQLPSTLKSLESNAFSECTKLIHIDLSSSMRKLPNLCFNKCNKLGSIDLSNITHMDYSCFSDCERLSSLTISKHLEQIGNDCFLGCSSLENIVVNENCSQILCHIPFFWSLLLACQGITCPNVKYTKEDVKRFGGVVPDGCSILEENCFSDQSINSISLPTSVTDISHECFKNCNTVTSIQFPLNIKKIEVNLFKFPSSLKTIYISSECKVVGSVDGIEFRTY